MLLPTKLTRMVGKLTLKDGNNMILTVTLNPAVDKTYRIGHFEIGEVNRMRETVSIAGGKGINVAKILRQFHIPVATMGFIGGNTGTFIEETMESLKADCRFTHIDEETRTSTNILADDGVVTEILEHGPFVIREEQIKFLKEFTGCIGECELVVFSGSAPRGVPDNIYEQLITICNAMGIKTILDASGELLRKGIQAKPYMIKPNRKELETLVGKRLLTEGELVDEARKLIATGIQKVVISLGVEGLLYVDETQVLREQAKTVEAVNTVACGDTVVASLCMSEIQGDEVEIALKKAVALSAANATTMESANIPMDTYLKLL